MLFRCAEMPACLMLCGRKEGERQEVKFILQQERDESTVGVWRPTKANCERDIKFSRCFLADVVTGAHHFHAVS